MAHPAAFAPLFPDLDARLVNLAERVAAVPLPVQLAFHSLFVLQRLRFVWGGARPYLQSLLTTFVAAYGGGLLAPLLLGEPSEALKSDTIVAVHIVSWYAYTHLTLVRVLVNLPVLRVFLGIYSNVLRAGIIGALVDKANASFGESSNVASLVLGTLGGCGGKYLLDAAHRLHFGQARTHGSSPGDAPQDDTAPAGGEFAPELRCPSFASRSALCCAVVQLVLVHRTQLLTPAAGTSLNAVLLVANGLYVEMYGSDAYDVTGYLANIFHALTGIPDPSPTGKMSHASQTEVASAPNLLASGLTPHAMDYPALTAHAGVSPMGSPENDKPLFLTTPVAPIPSANRDARSPEGLLGYRESASGYRGVGATPASLRSRQTVGL